MYRSEIIERYRFPRHKRVIKDADAQGEVINALCGDDITLYLKFDPNKRKLMEATFSGEGCALMHASADLLCGHITGKDYHELETCNADMMLALYGEPPTPSRLKCVLLPFEALKKGLKSI